MVVPNMAAKKESGAKRTPYGERLRQLMLKAQRKLQEQTDEDVSQRSMAKEYQALLRSLGLGSLSRGDSTFGPYFGGGGRSTKERVMPSTELGLAIYLQSILGVDDPGWGNEAQDYDTPLNHFRDLTLIDPNAKPDPTRWANEPSAAEIIAASSAIVEDIEKAVTSMDLRQTVEVLGHLTNHLRLMANGGLEEYALTPEPEPEPEPPCNEENASWLALSTILELESMSSEVVEQIAADSGLSLARTRQILCGDSPTAEEIDALSKAAKWSAKRFRIFVRSCEIELQEHPEEGPLLQAT